MKDAEFTLTYSQICLTGIIKDIRIIDNDVYTVLFTPAPDPYSNPSTFEIRSKKRLGTIGEEIPSLLCNLSGYHKKSIYRDKETGEQKYYTNKIVYITAVENHV